MSEPIETQVGGSHYKGLAIQPVEYVHANGIGYFEGNVIKYVSRWRQKNGIEDLKKAIHFLQLLIMFEERSDRGGCVDRSPCIVCGKSVECVPDGVPMCRACANQEE